MKTHYKLRYDRAKGLLYASARGMSSVLEAELLWVRITEKVIALGAYRLLLEEDPLSTVSLTTRRWLEKRYLPELTALLSTKEVHLRVGVVQTALRPFSQPATATFLPWHRALYTYRSFSTVREAKKWLLESQPSTGKINRAMPLN